MSPEQFLDAIFRHRALAIFRGHHQGRAAAAMDAAVNAGFRLVEFTVSTPGVLELIAEFARRPGIIVGAGTVLDIPALEAVVGAGAKFLASPVLDQQILSAARDLDVAVLPGCFSPTELLQAHRSGAACQKLFPAPGYLPSYVRAVLAPMPFLRIVPTNGVTLENAADVLAAIRFLQLQPNINPRQIGILGHSEGGIIAAMVAAGAPKDVRFIVMLGGTGLPGIDIKSLQDAAARRADGMPESLVLLNQSQERGLFEIAASKLGRQDAIAAMHAATSALPAQVKTTLEIPAEGLPTEAFEALLTPWFRRFLSLDPRAYLEKVSCPVLALVGEKDLQVPPAENLKEIERALKRGANSIATVRQLPGINHNLQTAITGKTSEYFLIEETVAPSVLVLVTAWMKDVAHNRD